MLRAVLNSSNALAVWVRRGQLVDPGPRPVRVNLGSALVVAPGWIHVDASPNALVAGRGKTVQRLAHRLTGSDLSLDSEGYRSLLNEHRFVHHDLRYGIPFADGAVDFVYTSHFLEHLDLAAGLSLLRESHRVLRPGGVIRVCVPDLEKAVQFYLSGDRTRFLSYFFTDGREVRHRHRSMYDFETLRKALGDAGFVDVLKCEFAAGQTPDLERLDNRSDETLYVEGVRPE